MLQKGVVSLVVLYRKFVVELTFKPSIPCLCFITQVFMASDDWHALLRDVCVGTMCLDGDRI